MMAIVEGELVSVVQDKTTTGKSFLRLQLLQNGTMTKQLITCKYWGTKAIGDFKLKTMYKAPCVIRPFQGKRGLGLDVAVFDS